MCQKNAKKKVGDIFQVCEFRACAADSMEEVAKNAPQGFKVIPVFDYSQKYIGGLQPQDFVTFQNEYFGSLGDDRGTEFVIEPADSDIHYVPINRVSRYVNKSIQPVGIGESIEQTEKILAEQGNSAAPVFDEDNHIVGTISLLDIAKAKTKKNCCKTTAIGDGDTGKSAGQGCGCVG